MATGRHHLIRPADQPCRRVVRPSFGGDEAGKMSLAEDTERQATSGEARGLKKPDG